MNELTDQQLAEIRKLASLLLPPRKIALALGYNPAEFSKACRLEHHVPSVHAAFHGGLLEQEIQLQQSVLQMAHMGSVPAQSAALGYVKDVYSKLQER